MLWELRVMCLSHSKLGLKPDLLAAGNVASREAPLLLDPGKQEWMLLNPSRIDLASV